MKIAQFTYSHSISTNFMVFSFLPLHCKKRCFTDALLTDFLARIAIELDVMFSNSLSLIIHIKEDTKAMIYV